MIKLEDFAQHLKSIKIEDWNKLFDLIPIIQKIEKFSHLEGGEKLPDGSMSLHHNVLCDPAKKLVDIIIQLKLAPLFNYLEWNESKEILKNQSFEKQNIITVCKFFTIMIRSERFCDGFIASWFQQGIVLKLLIRLKKLYIVNNF